MDATSWDFGFKVGWKQTSPLLMGEKWKVLGGREINFLSTLINLNFLRNLNLVENVLHTKRFNLKIAQKILFSVSLFLDFCELLAGYYIVESTTNLLLNGKRVEKSQGWEFNLWRLILDKQWVRKKYKNSFDSLRLPVPTVSMTFPHFPARTAAYSIDNIASPLIAIIMMTRTKTNRNTLILWIYN